MIRVLMKKITLSVDEKVLAVVRRLAAEQNSSVNALVRDYLGNLAAQDDRARRGRERLRELSSGLEGRLGKKTWKRDGLHDRDREEALRAIRRLARPLPTGFKFDREEVNRR
jgi:hypothetical protein